MGEITTPEVVDLVTEVVRESFYVSEDISVEETTALGDLIDNKDVLGNFGDVTGLAWALSEKLEEKHGVSIDVAGHSNLHEKTESDIRNLTILDITRIVVNSLTEEGY